MRNFYRDTLPAFQQKPPNGYGQKYFQPKAKRRNRNRGKKAVFSPIHQDFYEDATPSTLASQSKTINKWRDSPERTARKNPQGFTFQSLFDQANTIKKMPVVPMSFMPGMPVMPSMPVPQPDQYTTKFTYLKYMNVKRQKKYDIKCFLDEDLNIPVPVSYTHLTLPTIYSV
eukprot:TRINITY_DN1349_c0_g4_i2.p1 TRINITY_DN1349_c0_g4~~TRINITY_DN1349_c0_g4_i2.p1  ORF type:complete len:171 (+),score=28.82 TRINITY_DN1349_c0_g4_i2:75-587(+)